MGRSGASNLRTAVDLPDVVRVARVNAMVAAATGSLAEAAGELGVVDAPAAARLSATAGQC